MTRRYAKAPEVSVRRTEPTERDMEQINRFAKKPLGADEVFIGEIDLANDVVDRTHERFPPQVLRDFAASAPGKSMLVGHDYRRDPIGLFYDSRVRRDADRHTLVVKYYMVGTDRTAEMQAQIEGGVWRYASIGFTAGDLACAICGASRFRDWCQHVPGRAYEVGGKSAVMATSDYQAPAEMIEGSVVYLGAQYGAEIKGGDPALAARMRQAQFAAAAHHAIVFQKSVGGILAPRPLAGDDTPREQQPASHKDPAARALQIIAAHTARIVAGELAAGD